MVFDRFGVTEGAAQVFHGAEQDITWLQKDFDIYVVNLFDTYHATVILGMYPDQSLHLPRLICTGLPSHSLSALLQLYTSFKADKRYQMADWRIRPLPEEMLFYARADTHFLLFIYDSLRNALLEKSSRPPSPIEGGQSGIKQNPQKAMRQVLDLSADTALKLYVRDTYDPEINWGAPARKWLPQSEVRGEAGAVWQGLMNWRDRVARELDEGPMCVGESFVEQER